MRLVFIALLLPLILFAQDHLLISEILVPSSAETETAFIEVYNPGNSAVSLANTYISNYNTYYEMVNDVFTNNTSKFLIGFSGGEIPAKTTRVIAVDGAGFLTKFGVTADYEINGTDSNTPNVVAKFKGSNIKFETSSGMLVIFQWDGSSDLVKDLDYLAWGFFGSAFMDKSGVTIDGPDADSTPSAYLDDLNINSQKKASIPTGGKSLQRNGIIEIDEVLSGGNGVTGHNEATENWAASFVAVAASPGSFSEVEGDGSGVATISPADSSSATQMDVKINLTGEASYVVKKVKIIVPQNWSWSQTAADIQLSGSGLTSASASVTADTVIVSGANISATAAGDITFKNITSPATSTESVFKVFTAVEGGNLTLIGSSPSIAITFLNSIADIQDNFSAYNGKDVTIKGVVSIGAGVTVTSRTDTYVQDASGRGINVFKANELVAGLDRGNEVLINGSVTDYLGTTEVIVNTIEVLSQNNEIPGVQKMTIAQASDLRLEGTMVEVKGIVNDKWSAGGGTNIEISDGILTLIVRIWDTSGLNTDAFVQDSIITVRGIVDSFNGAPQLLLAYQEDISISTAESGGTLLELPARPFAPDHAEELEITFRTGVENAHVTMRIFDLGGRLVTTLLDKKGVGISATLPWDGRDERGELVTIGTYILHFEVTNEDTGKKTFKTAPIVVGTVLSR